MLEFRVAISYLRLEGKPEYDDLNWRWYLSVVSMTNESTVDLHYNLNLKENLEP